VCRALISAAHGSPVAQWQRGIETAVENGREWREETTYLEKDRLI